jgi:hypothetical protein
MRPRETRFTATVSWALVTWSLALGSIDAPRAQESGVRALAYATRLGGSGSDLLFDQAMDDDGNVYVTGGTTSSDFPLKNAVQTTIGGDGGSSSAFVAKIDGVSGGLLFSTYFGGRGNDRGSAIALDRAGNIYVAGITASDNLPATAGALQPTLVCPAGRPDCEDGFLLKLGANGRVQAATYLGLGGKLEFLTMAVGSDATVYLAGTARQPLERSETLRFSGGSSDGFVAKLTPDLTGYAYAAHVGTSGSDHVSALAVDAQGHAYVGGAHDGDCTVARAAGVFSTPVGCLYAAKLTADGQALVWLSRFGGMDRIAFLHEEGEMVTDLAVDAAGNLYIAGWTRAATFPTTAGAAQRTVNPGADPIQGDGFVAKLMADGTELAFSTLVGGSGFDGCTGLYVEPSGTVQVVGNTYSADLAGRRYTTTSSDAFAARLSADGSAVLNLAVFGGSSFETPWNIGVGRQGAVWLSGVTHSPDFPATATAFDRTSRSDWDGMLVRLPWTGDGATRR